MQLILTNDMLAPSVCVVCEQTPQTDQVVDTLTRIEGFSKLSGRKYVCDQCVKQFAQLLGYEQGVEVQKAQWERDVARKEVANIRKQLDEFAKSLVEVVNHPGVADGTSFEASFGSPDLVRASNAQAERVVLPEGAKVESSIGSGPVKETDGSSGPKK